MHFPSINEAVADNKNDTDKERRGADAQNHVKSRHPQAHQDVRFEQQRTGLLLWFKNFKISDHGPNNGNGEFGSSWNPPSNEPESHWDDPIVPSNRGERPGKGGGSTRRKREQESDKYATEYRELDEDNTYQGENGKINLKIYRKSS